MGDIQVTHEIVVELSKFHNIDLFQRGYYQLRLSLRQPPKLLTIVECEQWKGPSGAQDTKAGLFSAFVTGDSKTAISRTFEVYYKHEEISINDVFIFKFHLLLDSSKINEQNPKTIVLDVDLFFADCNRSPSTPKSLRQVSNQLLNIHLTPMKSFHHHRNIIFDYFNLGAVSLTVHSCMVAIRQPWLGPLKALHPLLSSRSSSKQHLHSALFGKSAASLPSDMQVSEKQHSIAANAHKRLCLQLLKTYANLLQYFHHAMTFLPDYAQMRVSQPDINSKLDVLSNEYDNLWTVEEMFSRMGDDLYLLSTELSMLWMQFLEQFIKEGFLVAHLKEEHHRLRLEHLAEAFFVEDHDWEEFCTPFDLTTTQYTSIANLVKGSSYYQMMPALKLECISIDGDSNSMPIIFEDRFIAGKTLTEADGIQHLSVEESMFDDFIDLAVSVDENSKTDGVFKTAASSSAAEAKDVKLAWSSTEDQKSDSLVSNSAPVFEPEIISHRGETTFCVVGSKDDVRQPARPTASQPLSSKDDIFENKYAVSNRTRGQPSNHDEQQHHSALVKSSSCVDTQPTAAAESMKERRTGSNKGKAYKLVMRSPNGGSLRDYGMSRKEMTRFEKAKQLLKAKLNLPADLYSDVFNPSTTKPYFTERILSSPDRCHLVICVHGLDGNSGDLRLVRCYLELALPRANFDFLMSEVNQEDTFLDIDQLTEKLACEILQHIEMNHLDPYKISFVGHSLGNVIIRNAVVHAKLLPFRGRLHTFLSLSGPHLGMLYQTSSLVSTGLWLMQKWKKSGSLPQLALNDCSDLRDTFMYRLSLTNGFQYFKNVLLVSSVQDHYVPFHSSRIEMSKQAMKDTSETGRVYKEMVDNILLPLKIQNEVNVIRYSVNHVISSSANSLIGRAAHIAMLDSELFIEKLIRISACEYFR
eukprot:gene4689-5304_t